MKKFAIIYIFFLLGLFGCSEPDPVYLNNNVLEESFEKNNMPLFEQWQKNFTDSLLKFAEDVPRDGGRYSIYLESIWGPPLSISREIDLNAGNYVLDLEVWSKTENVEGLIELGIQKQDTFEVLDTILVKAAQWTSYKKSISIELGISDKVKLVLSGGSSQLLQGRTYYDKITIKKE